MIWILFFLSVCNILGGCYILHYYKKLKIYSISYPIVVSVCSIECVFIVYYISLLYSPLSWMTIFIYILKSIYLFNILFFIYKHIILKITH